MPKQTYPIPVKRILVTGAAGYSGRWLVKHLCDREYVVRGGDLLPTGALDKYSNAATPALDERAEWVRLDVSSEKDIDAALQGGVDTVFHIAAVVPYNLGSAIPFTTLFRVNIMGTHTLLAKCKEYGVKNFIFASSTGVVFAGADVAGGNESLSLQSAVKSAANLPHFIREKDIPADLYDALQHYNPAEFNDPYSYTKCVAEHLVRAASAASNGENVDDTGRILLASVSVRPNGIWGVGEQHHIPKLLTTAQIGGTGAAVAPHALTDFTHRDNLVHAFHLALRQLTASPESRRLVSGKAYFVTDNWPCHTLEFFSPLLSGLGFTPAFRSQMVPRGTTFTIAGGETRTLTTNCRLPVEEFNALQTHMATCATKNIILSDAERSCQADDAVPRPSSPTSARRRRSASPGKAKPTSYAFARMDHGEAGGDDIVITAKGPINIPGALMYPAAVILQGLALLLRPILNPEPFLTVADVRKVVHHNYYSSALAERELGYAPVRSPASGLRELISYYRADGYNGAVVSPPLAAWISVIVGLTATALLAFNTSGLMTAVLALLALYVPAPILSAIPEVLATTYRFLGVPQAAAAVANGIAACTGFSVSHLATEPPTVEAALMDLLKVIFYAAMLCHMVQGLWTMRFTWRNKSNALGWGIQSAILGFPSTQLAIQAAGRPIGLVPILCVSGFLICLQVFLVLHHAWHLLA